MSGHFSIGAVTPTRYFFGIAIVLGLLFALITPGTGEVSDSLRRLFQWQVQTLGPMALLILSHLFLHQWESYERLNPWLKLGLSGTLGAVLFSPFALALDLWLLEETITQGQWLAAWLKELSNLAPPVIICWMAINAPWLLGFRLVKHDSLTRTGQTSTAPASPVGHSECGNEDPPFFKLIPSVIRAEVVYLKAELHYLEVVTVNGKALILYNLKDAIREMPQSSGVQTHRSYWVATSFVESFKKRGRQGFLHLTNGESIPVSRRNLEAVTSLLAHAPVYGVTS